MVERCPAPVYRVLTERLDRLGLAYLHLTDSDSYPALAELRPRYAGTIIANVGENRAATTRPEAEKVLASGLADAVSFGRGFLVNPDLPARLCRDLPWNSLDHRHLYARPGRLHGLPPGSPARSGSSGARIPRPSALPASNAAAGPRRWLRARDRWQTR